MSHQQIRDAAALMRERAEAATALPRGAARCRRSEHPDRPHGHYGFGGAHWCSDFNSPLLNDENMGSRDVYAKPVKAADMFLLSVARMLDCAVEWSSSDEPEFEAAVAVANAYITPITTTTGE